MGEAQGSPGLALGQRGLAADPTHPWGIESPGWRDPRLGGPTSLDSSLFSFYCLLVFLFKLIFTIHVPPLFLYYLSFPLRPEPFGGTTPTRAAISLSPPFPCHRKGLVRGCKVCFVGCPEHELFISLTAAPNCGRETGPIPLAREKAEARK